MILHHKTFKEPGGKLVFVALNCFFVGVTVAWLGLHRAPPWWDDAWYLTHSLGMFDALTRGGIAGYARKFLGILGTKAPLMTVLPTPIYLVLGRNFRYAFLVNVLSMPLLFLAVYSIGRKHWNSRAGLIAVYIVGTMPLMYGLSRWYLAEYTLTAVVCLALYFLIRSQDFADTRSAFLFGLTCGFGLLLKVSFPLYVIFPFLYVFVRFLLRTRASSASGVSVRLSRARTMLAVALPAVSLSLPWYLFNARRTIQAALVSGFSKEADLYGIGRGFSSASIKSYLVSLVGDGPSCYYVFLAALLIVVLAATGKTRTFLTALKRESIIVLSLWALPFLVFYSGRNKDIRFVAPLLPAFGLMLAFALDFTINGLGRWRYPILCLLLAFSAIAFLEASFAVLGNRTLRAGDFRLISPELRYAHVYNRTVFPQHDILNTICQHTRFRAGEKKTLMIATDRAGLNSTNLELMVAQEQLPFNLRSTAHEDNLDAFLSTVRSASFFVYKDGGEPESQFLNKYLNAMLRDVQANTSFVEIPYRRTLPDGGIVHILKNLSAEPFGSSTFIPAGLDRLPSCQIDFDHKIQLTGLAVGRTQTSLDVNCRWRSIKPVEREYRCFIHNIDEHDQVVGYLDHELLGGDPPTRWWKAGDQALEHVSFRFAKPQAGGELRLKIGLYHLGSGERLPISSSATLAGGLLPVADENTAAIVKVPQNQHEPGP